MRTFHAPRPLLAGLAALLLLAIAPGFPAGLPTPPPVPPPPVPPPLPPPDADTGPEAPGQVRPVAPPGVVYCPVCGAENRTGSRFCREDGAPLPALDPGRFEPGFVRAAETFSRDEIQDTLALATLSVVRIQVTTHGPSVRYPVITGDRHGREARLVVEAGDHEITGSGFVLGAVNEVVTNAHVAEPFEGVSQIQVRTRAGLVLKARPVGIDRPTDLALLRVDGANLPALEWGDSDRLHVGEETWAIGHPIDIGLSVTRGTISSLDHMRAGLNEIESYLHSDASITHGNSGGPLVNVLGRVVGVSDMGFHEERGQGYSIPSNMARRVIDRLRKGGKYERGFVGLHLWPIDAAAVRRFTIKRDDGLVVASILPGSPAAAAGFREGDVVHGINGRYAVSPYLLQEAVSSVGPGQRIRLNVDRAGESLALEVTTAPRPAAPRPDPVLELSTYLNARFEEQAGRGVVVRVEDAFSLAQRNGFADGDRIDSVLPAADWPEEAITIDYYTRRARPVEVRRLDDLRAALGRAVVGGRFGALFFVKSPRTALAGVAYDEIVPIVL